MSTEYQKSELAHSAAAYKTLGIERGAIQQFEDGRRTGDGKTEYEWWYFDCALDDGSTLVIAFFTKDVKGGLLSSKIKPLCTFELDTPDGRHFSERVEPGEQAFSAAQKKCEVHIGQCSARGDLHRYEVAFRGEQIQADLVLTGSVPSWRPETGTMLYGNDESKNFNWLPSVPEGILEGAITIDGKTIQVRGTGYHDHNWGNVPMMEVLNHWYWGRAKIGPYKVISAYLIAEKKYGFAKMPLFMLYRDGEFLCNDFLGNISFSVPNRYCDPVTGRLCAQTTVYDYNNTLTGERYVVTYERKKTLLQERMVDMLPKGLVQMAAKLIRFPGAYQRFAGTCTIEKYLHGKKVESYTDPAIWEQMFFGSTPDSETV